MTVLSPEAGIPVEEDTLNNVSLVLKLDYGETSVLFTGDAEREVEEKLLEGVFEHGGMELPHGRTGLQHGLSGLEESRKVPGA